MFQGVFFWSLALMLLCCSSLSWRGLYVSFDLPRMLAFQVLFVVAGMSGGLFMMSEPALSVKRLRSPIWLAVLLLASCLVLSTCFSKDAWISFFGSYYRRIGLSVLLPSLLLVPLIGVLFGRTKTVFSLAVVISCIGLLNSGYGFLQAAGHDFLGVTKALEGSPYSVRPSGFAGNPDFLGPFLVVSLFLSLSCGTAYLLRGRRFLGAFFLFSGLLQIATVIMSLTRASWLGMAFGLVLWILLVSRYVFRLSRTRTAFVAAGLVSAVCVCVLLMCLFVPNFKATVSSKAKSLFTMSEKYFYTGEVVPVERPYLWRDTLRCCWAELKGGRVLGVGPENFQKNFLKYKGYELSSISLNKFYDSPHCVYLSVLATCGILGFLAYLSVIGVSLIMLCSFFRRSAERLNLAVMAGLGSGLAAYLVNQVGAVEVIGNLVLFNILLGMIWAMHVNLRLKFSPVAAHEGGDGPSPRLGTAAGLVFAAFSVLFCLPCLWTGLKQARADIYYNESLKYSGAAHKMEGKDIDTALELLKKACEACPKESYYAIDRVRLLGEKACRLGKEMKQEEANDVYDSALEQLDIYEKRSWNPPILYMAAGVASYQFGFLDNAIACFENAAEWDRFNTHVHTVLGSFYHFRYNVVQEEDSLLKAFNNFSASVRTLKYFPHKDPLAFQSTVSLGNMIYSKKKEMAYLSRSVEALGLYALYAPATPANRKLFDETLALAGGTTLEKPAAAAALYFKYRSGTSSADATLKELRGLKLEGSAVTSRYFAILEGKGPEKKGAR